MEKPGAKQLKRLKKVISLKKTQHWVKVRIEVRSGSVQRYHNKLLNGPIQPLFQWNLKSLSFGI